MRNKHVRNYNNYVRLYENYRYFKVKLEDGTVFISDTETDDKYRNWLLNYKKWIDELFIIDDKWYSTIRHTQAIEVISINEIQKW